ncbi:ABC-three component system middle component 1 [Pseudomonas lundensis]|uniref:ABC-three component system middle component 1 n=1 Tax=Serratia proteamaculans TaxID=28151 RepID=UPI002980F69D|nr:ABC-three component system middle component 1 [Serratia proteamaculans]MDW5499144.1 ABC-three component system middle component 1 [Serratia proteamaculans]MDW5504205.1 ABC-three component system middle component 1 [Pseudomonas lundensis]
MLNEFIKQAIEEHHFIEIESESDEISFFKKEIGELRRYIITYRTDKLEDATILNELIINNTPTGLLEAPAFAKNTDLIIIFQLNKLSNYKQYEKHIFDVEENAYYFKKYVLYYSSEENKLISGKNFNNIKAVLSDHEEFSSYKADPSRPSLYNMAARIFIKLPFLEMPDIEKDIVPIDLQISTLVGSLNLSGTYNKISTANKQSDTNLEILIEELINEELEAIKAENK